MPTCMKEHISFRLPPATIERVRAAVDHHRGPPHFLTLNLFVERAIERELGIVEKKNGGRFATSTRKVSA